VTQPLARLQVERDGGAVRIAIVGEVDLSNAADLEDQFEDATSGAAVVVVDLTPVTYLDSRGIRLLVQLARSLRTTGGELSVIAPQDSIAGGTLRLVEIPEIPLVEG
jgi:anti-anti-sigma factor